jgi:hypothetical protein
MSKTNSNKAMMKAADDKTSAPIIQISVKAQVTAFSTLPFAGTRKLSGFFLKPGPDEPVPVRLWK